LLHEFEFRIISDVKGFGVLRLSLYLINRSLILIIKLFARFKRLAGILDCFPCNILRLPSNVLCLGPIVLRFRALIFRLQAQQDALVTYTII
jgi:hypothetical protein